MINSDAVVTDAKVSADRDCTYQRHPTTPLFLMKPCYTVFPIIVYLTTLLVGNHLFDDMKMVNDHFCFKTLLHWVYHTA